MTDAEQRARAWAGHVRAGGTVPWRAWAGDAAGADVPVPGVGRDLPDGAHLELLRRLNVLGWPPELTGAVLHRPRPGRGVAVPRPPGRHPSPAAVEEVLRVGAGVLADLAARLPAPEVPPSGPRPAVVLAGPPLTVAHLRPRVPPAARRPWRAPRPVLLVAAPVDLALAEAWARRTAAGAARPWGRFVRRWARRGCLPPGIDVGRLARMWVERVGPAKVHVVGPEQVVAALLALAPAGATAPGTPLPAYLAAADVDVVRRVNAVLPFVAPPPDLAARRSALVALATPLAAPAAPPRLPEAPAGAVVTAAQRAVRQVRETGCVVHGPLPVEPAGGTPLRRADVLDAMIRMIHSAATGRGGR